MLKFKTLVDDVSNLLPANASDWDNRERIGPSELCRLLKQSDSLQHAILADAENTCELDDSLFKRDYFPLFLLGFGGTGMAVTGLIANLLSLVHFFHISSHLSSVSKNFLIATNVWDCVVLITTWYTVCLNMLLGKGKLPTEGRFVTTYGVGYAAMCVAWTGVIWNMLAMTASRFVAICFPFHVKLRAVLQGKMLLIASMLLPILFNFFRAFEITYSRCCDIDTYELQYRIGLAPYAKPGSVYHGVYKVTARFCFVTVGPFVAILYLTVRTAWTMSRHSNTKSTSHKSSIGSQSRTDAPKRRKANIALLILSFKFLAFHSLPIITDLVVVGAANPRSIPETEAFNKVIDVASFLVMFHSATNSITQILVSNRLGKRRSTLSVDTMPMVDLNIQIPRPSTDPEPGHRLCADAGTPLPSSFNSAEDQCVVHAETTRAAFASPAQASFNVKSPATDLAMTYNE